MERLYALSAKVYALRPWEVLEEGELVLTRDSGTGETCYCAVMGALGQVIAVYAYIGVESYRLFRRMLAGEVSGAGEFYEVQRSVSLEFVPARELDAQDRKLLTALRHPIRSAGASPVFRAGRPGFFPWYVTEQEARLLEECSTRRNRDLLRRFCKPQAQLLGTALHLSFGLARGWKRRRVSIQHRIGRSYMPQEPPLAPRTLGRNSSSIAQPRLSGPGTLELDHFPSGAKIERKTHGKRASGLQWPSMLKADPLPPDWRPLMFDCRCPRMAIIRAAEASPPCPRRFEFRIAGSRTAFNRFQSLRFPRQGGPFSARVG